jgi:hypothetical protein
VTGPLDVSRREAIEITNRHSRGEVSNDMDKILPTLSQWDLQFSLVADGEDGLVVNEAHDLETVRGWYEANRKGYELHPGAIHTKLTTTEWYRFHEVLAPVEHLGSVPQGVPHPPFPSPGEGGTGPGGSVYWVPLCVLFPVSPDGIVGELSVWQFDMKELFQGRTPPARPVAGPAPHLNGIEYRNARMLREFAAAWQDGDVDAMLADFADDCWSTLRVVRADDESRRSRTIARGTDEHRALLAPESFGRVNQLTVLAIVQSPWYIFIEYDLDLEVRGDRVLRKMAAVYPIGRDGAILGQLAYAVDRDPGAE